MKFVDTTVKERLDCYLTGSTAIVIFIDSKNIYVANLGDSRAILANSASDTLTAIQLTEDQKPQNPEETERIKQAGGYVARLCDPYTKERIGPYRVW